MRFPRNGRRRGGRWLTAVLARWLGVGAVPAWCRRAWAWPRRRVRVVGACLPGALERRARRAPSSGPSGRSMRWMSGGGSSLPSDCSAAPAGARDRDRSRRPARPGRAAATVLVLGLALLGAAPAEAQTPRVLVSNQAQMADDSASTSGNDHAQLFHTGGNTAGYILTSMHVSSEDAEGDDFDVEICEEDGTANEFPSTTASDCTALTAPASFAAGLLFFDHTGLALSANTNYVVVIKQRGTGSVELNSTTSSGEDAALGLSDWSIKDTFYWNNSGTWTVKSGANEALRIIVNGYAVTVDTTDATLSALSVSGATLSPAFDAATTDYGVVVANAVSQVTITETKSESTATVEYLDGSDNTLTDADTMTAGLQVNLSVGTNIVKVKVTAPDTTTTKTYTVDIVRFTTPGSGTEIWSATLTVATATGSAVGFIGSFGTLSDTTFTYEGTNYTIDNVTVVAGAVLVFSLDGVGIGDDAANLLLLVGTQQFPFSEATYGAGTYSYSWYSNVPSWSVSDSIALRITDDSTPVPPVPPAVTSVALTSDPGLLNTYGIGDAVEATVTFSEAVDITGTPQLELDFNGTAKAAACATGTNTTTMACSYTVVVGDSAPNGVAIAANKLTGGTIYATGSTTTTADLTHIAVMIDAGHKVDGIRPTLVTTGSDAPTTSTDGTKVILTFSEALASADSSKFLVTVTTSGSDVTSAVTAATISGSRVTVDHSGVVSLTSTLTITLTQLAVADLAGNTNNAVVLQPVTNAITANEPPEFSSPTATREVPENTAANTNIGTALPAATDADNDPLTYTLEDADAASFGFDPATRQLSTESGVTYDHETKPSYSVTLKAEDDNGGSDTLAVTITVTDVEEPPGRPAAPSVSSVDGNTTSLSVNWTTPSNTGPAIDNYDLQYREGTSGSWTNGPQNVSGTSATISGLTESTSYQVQVLATNAEGDSPWSLPGSGQTGALGAPDVPHSLDATPGNRQVMLSWVQPSGGAEVTHYEYELDGSEIWISTGGTATSHTVTGLNNGQTYMFRVRAVNALGSGAVVTLEATPSPSTGGGGGGGPRQTVPSAPRNLLAEGGDGQVKLSWDPPEDDGGSEIRDYEYRIDGKGRWISIGSTDTTDTVTGLVNGTAYVFEVRAVNRIGRGRASNQAEATPEAPEVFALDFAHFANGTGITSEMVLVNVSSHPIRPAIYFYDRGGRLIDPASVVDVTVDLEVTEDGGLTVRTEMEPLGELTISTHGQGELVSGSVKVLSDGPIGGGVRYGVPEIGVAGVGASPPVSDVLFPVRRQEGGITTGVALHNLESSAGLVHCDLMREGVLLDGASIPLEANGQTAWLIDQAFPGADTSDFAGSVRCSAPGGDLFTAVALEMDPGTRIFTTLPVVPVPEMPDQE